MLLDDNIQIEYSLDHLPEPLIPVPYDFTAVEDIYTIPEDEKSERWRPWIDSENWDPKVLYEGLGKKRAYHARLAWEACQLIALTDVNWLCTGTLETIRDIALIEVRRTEIDMVSYQLTLGMIGIGAKERVKLYHAAVNIYLLTIKLSKQIMGKDPNATQKKALKELMMEKPNASDSKRRLSRMVDDGLVGVRTLLGSERVGDDPKFVEELARLMRLLVIALDAVIVILV